MSHAAGISAAERDGIDREHSIQVGLLDALTEALRGGGGPPVMEIVDQLLTFCYAHFMSEQLLMRQCSYPEYDAHVLDHDRMIESLHEMAAGHAGGAAPAMDDVQRIREFLLRHIGNRDTAFMDYYRDWMYESMAPPLRPAHD